MRILVLAGGPSSEREISLEGGRAVTDACRRLGHEVAVADFLPDNHAALDLPCDVVFPVLHGPYGEDGTLQAILDERGLPYVGSGAAASRLCMDKHAAKSRWRDAGLPTAAWAVVEREQWLPCFQDHGQGAGMILAGNAVEPPVVVKPVGEGSSVGVVFCATWEETFRAAREAMERYDRVLVERRMVGRELTVGILDQSVLPMVEIQPAAAFYDYEAKYTRDDTQYIVEPDLDPATHRAVQDMALAAYRLLGCRHYGRVDLILDERDGPRLLEINTIPGFTRHSLLPKAAAHVGISFDQLVQTLIELAAGESPLGRSSLGRSSLGRSGLGRSGRSGTPCLTTPAHVSQDGQSPSYKTRNRQARGA